MNSIMEEYYPLFQMYQSLRAQLLDALEEGDLDYRPGSANPALGTLCREIGETQRAYIESFKSFRCSFDYHEPDPALTATLAGLRAWYAEMDSELRAVVEALSEEEIQQRKVDRGHGFEVPPLHHLDIYKEALLIFYGKASVYARALNRQLPQHWQAWIG